MADVSTCPTCRIVQTVCFWGPLKAVSWKRPALLLASTLIIAGMIVLAISVVAPAHGTWQWLLLAPILAFGVMGLVVALLGCANCVARIFGSI